MFVILLDDNMSCRKVAKLAINIFTQNSEVPTPHSDYLLLGLPKRKLQILLLINQKFDTLFFKSWGRSIVKGKNILLYEVLITAGAA